MKQGPTKHLVLYSILATVTSVNGAAAGCLAIPNRSNALRKMSQRRRKNRSPSSSMDGINHLKKSNDDSIDRKRNSKFQLRPGDLFSIDFVCPPIDESGNSAGPFPSMYTNDPSTVNSWIERHVYSNDDCYFVGFDTESVPNAPWMADRGLSPGPATIQLSTTKSSIIIHLSHCHEIPASLTDLMYNNEIVKVGVGIDEDMLDLYRIFGEFLEGRCRFDLAGIGSKDGQMSGLKTLLSDIVGVNLSKPRRITRSNWSSLPLSEKQLFYGARDAWAAVVVMEKLRTKRPDIFGSKGSLFSMLQSERNMDEIDKRARKRKEVKSAWKDLFYKVKKSKKKDDLDTETLKNFNELDKSLRILRPDGMIVFDPTDLRPLG